MSDRPTVAVDLRALVGAPTGIGYHTASLLRELSARPRFRYLGLAHQEPQGAAELGRQGVELAVRPAPLGVLWQQLRLPGELRRRHASLLWSPIFTLPWRCPVPAVVTVHDLTPILHPELHRLKLLLSLRPFLAHSLRSARRIVAVSQATADDLARLFPACADKTVVVHNGVDREFVPAEPPRIRALREGLGAPGGYVLFVGTLEPRKNLPRLLDAWELLQAAGEELPPLLLAGPYGWRSGTLAERLRSLAARGVRYLGHLDRSRLVELVQAARLFVYPSLYEGFGLPVLEAMACGVPVVTSDASSLPELVGDSGLTVPPTETPALAEAIRRLLRDPAAAGALGQLGLARAARFSWERAAEALESIFAESLESP